jgi:antitoxin component of RelBE/YafQ-DinJ toxin-antitoxin module
MKTILQVPVDKQLKDNAERAASLQGFSSLQEIVRVFLTQLATNKVEVRLGDAIILSPENERRYINMTSDFESGDNVSSVDSVDDLLIKLNEN